MQSIWDTKFIVVDVETTGSKPEINNIIEISCIIVKNGEILGEFSTLVNPRQNIPFFITRMTGITNEMTFRAPEFRQIIPDLMKLFTRNSVFVAHNANFDYSFVQKSFEKNGYKFPDLPKLCTLRLARRLVSGISKKNVGALSEYFGIPIRNRHRAFGDARATAQILIELLEIAENEHNIHELTELIQFQYKPYFSYNVVQKIIGKPYIETDQIPDSPGVYFFYDNQDKVIYVGKAKSLKKRIQSYFTTTTSRKILQLLKSTKKVNWIITPTELRALIEENRQIKLHKPQFNSLSKKLRSYPFIQVAREKKFPVFQINYEPNPNEGECFGPFKNRETAELIIDIIYRKFRLKKCNYEIDRKNPELTCFYFQTKTCLAPCRNGFVDNEYEEEIKRIREFLTTFENGLLQTLESLMFSYAENYDFEQANELKDKIFEIKKVFGSPSINLSQLDKRNFLAIYQKNGSSEPIEVLLICNGKLVWDTRLRNLEELNSLRPVIFEQYSQQKNLSKGLEKEEVEEVRIVTNWLNQHHYALIILDIDELLKNL